MSKKSNNFKLSPEEIKAQFDELDLNKNGVIDESETHKALQMLGIPSETGMIRWQAAMVKEFGVEKKELNLQEFTQYVNHRSEEINKLFREVDKNGDGNISQDELKQTLARCGLGSDPEILQQIFHHLDVDQSGDISEAEWRKILLLSPTQELEEMLTEWADISALGHSKTPVPPLPHNSSIVQAIKQILIGTFAGSVAKTTLAPLSRVKIIMQVAEQSTSIFAAAAKIYQEKGIRSFYRGNLCSILKSGPETGAKLLCFDLLKDYFADKDGHLSGTSRFVAGGLASIFSHTLGYPIDLVKTRLEASPHYKGIGDCALSLYRAEGFIPAFYRGLPCVWVSTFPSSGITLGMYSYLSNMLREKYGNENVGASKLAMASCSAAIVSEVLTYPVHLAKSRLAAQGSPGVPKKYNGLIDFFPKVYAQDGFKGFYRGMVPALLKHTPSVAITMTTYDILKKYFGITKPSKHH